jgi:hypothetical protein
MDNASTMAMPHFLMELDEQNLSRTSFQLPASDSCGDVCAAECLVNGQNMLVVTVYMSPNIPSDDWKVFMFSNFAGYSPKLCKMFKFLARRCEDMPTILAAEFNVNVKDNYDAELVVLMKDTFELDILSYLSQGTTASASYIDMVFGRNVDNLPCMNFVSYFSYHRPYDIYTNSHDDRIRHLSNIMVITATNLRGCMVLLTEGTYELCH